MKPTRILPPFLAAASLAAAGAAEGQTQFPGAMAPRGPIAGSDRFPILPMGAGAAQAGQASDIQAYVLNSVAAFGAKCDGRADDSAAINAALKAAAGSVRVVTIPPGPGCAIGSTIYVPGGVTLQGAGQTFGGGLSAAVRDLDPMIQLTGTGATVRDLFVNAAAAGVNRSGWAIRGATVGAPAKGVNNALISHVWIDRPCGGIDISGSYNVIENTSISQPQNAPGGSGCEGVRWGRLTAYGASVDGKIDYLEIIDGALPYAQAADAGIEIQDSGGIFVHALSVYGTRTGTLIDPGLAGGAGGNQAVVYSYIHNSALGDTQYAAGLLIDTLRPDAVISAFNCIDCWSSSSAAGDIVIRNTGGGKIDGLHFNALRSLGFYAPGGAPTPAINVNVGAGSDVTFTGGSVICGYTTAGLAFGDGVSGFTVDASRIGDRCETNAGPSGAAALLLAGRNDRAVITGNTLTVVTGVAVSGSPIGDSQAANNIGLGLTPSIAGGPTIALTGINAIYRITGTSLVTTIKGFWNNREVMLVPVDGTVTFATGGNLCNAVTVTRDTPVRAVFDPSAACWRMGA